MNTQEFHRLMSFHKSNQLRREMGMGQVVGGGKRLIKGRGKGVGCWHKKSTIKSEVRLLECNS